MAGVRKGSGCQSHVAPMKPESFDAAGVWMIAGLTGFYRRIRMDGSPAACFRNTPLISCGLRVSGRCGDTSGPCLPILFTFRTWPPFAQAMEDTVDAFRQCGLRLHELTM